MAVFRFTATDALAPGIAANSSVELVAAIERNPINNGFIGEEFKPMLGAAQRFEAGREATVQVRTDWIEKPDWPKWDMFMASVLGGQLFEVDLETMDVSSAAYRSAQFVGTAWKPEWPSNLLKVYSFQVRLL